MWDTPPSQLTQTTFTSLATPPIHSSSVHIQQMLQPADYSTNLQQRIAISADQLIEDTLSDIQSAFMAFVCNIVCNINAMCHNAYMCMLLYASVLQATAIILCTAWLQVYSII